MRKNLLKIYTLISHAEAFLMLVMTGALIFIAFAILKAIGTGIVERFLGHGAFIAYVIFVCAVAFSIAFSSIKKMLGVEEEEDDII